MTEQAKTFQQVISNFSLKEIPFYLQWSGPAFTDVPADGDWGEGMYWTCTIMIEDEDGDPVALGACTGRWVRWTRPRLLQRTVVLMRSRSTRILRIV